MDTLTAESRDTADDSLAFRALLGPHCDAAYNMARYMIGDPSAAEDITQDALLRAYRGLGGLRGSAVRPWLMAIVRNACADYRRKNPDWRNRARRGVAEAEEALLGRNTDNPEAAAIRQDNMVAVRRAIRALPLALRETLLLREIEDLSYRDIAQVTDVPVGTVMSRLARARSRLGAAFRVDQAPTAA